MKPTKEQIQHVNYHLAAPAMIAALKVTALDARISAWLAENDPQALKQIDNAIADAEPYDVPPIVAARIAARAKAEAAGPLTDEQRVPYATNPAVMQHGPKIVIRDNDVEHD